MKSTSEAILVVGLLLMGLAPGVLILPASAQTSLPLVELGYGPTSLRPVSQGIPIYAAGDEIWLMSEYNQSVSVALFPPSSVTATIRTTAYPGTPLRLRTFVSTDSDGNWLIAFRLSNYTYNSMQVSLNKAPSFIPPALTASSLSPNGTLSMSFVASLGEAYNAQGCFMGSGSPVNALVPFPAEIASGSVAVRLPSLGWTGVEIASNPTLPPKGSVSFDFWLELYYPYSATPAQDSSQIVTSYALVAKTAAVTLPANSAVQASLNLTRYVEPRVGRYDLRVYFRSATGLSVYETTMLGYLSPFSNPPQRALPAWNWIWFGGCSRLANLESQFTVTYNLGAPLGTWPVILYSAFVSGGVEGVSVSYLPLNLSRIALVPTPYAGRLPGSVAINVRQNSKIIESVSYNGTVYSMLRSVPTNITISLGYPGIIVMNSTVRVGSSDDASEVSVPLGKLVVAAKSNGVVVPHASVAVSELSGPRQIIAVQSTGPDGSTAFLLLEGNYSVFLSYGAFNATSPVTVVPGELSVLNVEVIRATGESIAYGLMALAAVGVALNMWVWRRSLFGGLRARPP